ncbi:thymidylate kinase [Rhodopseudomonas palustris HaA2]|uniref:Thymidylate kinase n=1 Tax=Rhodopseudomonas palustris (strain HaA2) TaxID=316058 RepID=Q2IWM9_RHOP2|nr:dTMP kinase [Rhodopseudomonas palustris]ABD07381.1 thymidylate kinase [Rhodopseudomonas palustris HaA2]
MLEQTTQTASACGHFITFEGGEGAGKSTQIRLLAQRLEKAGLETLVTREPGGSPGAEIIRHLLLAGVGRAIGGAEAEALLFAAARDDHVRTLIQPALDRGVWVLCDRFYDSTRVYQGRLGDVSPGMLNALQDVTIGTMKPDLTVILDVPVEIGLARAAVRRGSDAPDRFESENIDFHRRLRDAYRQIARAEPERCVLVDAHAEPKVVADRIWLTVQERLLQWPQAKPAVTPKAKAKTKTKTKARSA